MIARYELVLQQIEEIEAERDQVLQQEAGGEAEAMIKQLCRLKGIGAQFATVLVREFRNGRGVVHLRRTDWDPMGERSNFARAGHQQGGQSPPSDGRGRVGLALAPVAAAERALAVARHPVGAGGGRLRKVLVVALARKLLIALWRFARNGIVPDGAVLKVT